MIPLANDTRQAIGDFADKVENRSLLFEKMVLSKSWGHEGRFNDANRFNVLRACSSGDVLILEDQKAAQYTAGSHRARPQVKEEAAYRAKVAGALAQVRVDSPELAQRQVDQANQFLAWLEQSYQGRCVTFVGRLGGRLLINMAGGVQENAGLALDRCFGLPFIPGSAVKGVARAYALWDIRRTEDRVVKLNKLRLALLAFGFTQPDITRKKNTVGDFLWAANDDGLIKEATKPWTTSEAFKGLLSFLPAYPTETPTVVAEVLTPHPRAGERREPHPIFFPAVEHDSLFGFALVVTRTVENIEFTPVLEQAGAWLRAAITEQGIGAKTGAGYGWFIIDPQAQEKRRAAMAEMTQKNEQDRIKAQAEAAAADALAKAQADTAIMARFKALPPDQFRARLNKFEFTDTRFWPTSGEEANPVFQLSLLQLLLADDALRAEMASKSKGAKALKNLAAKFNRPLP